jgi:hypothetical protein
MRRGDTHVCLSFKCGVGTVVIKNCDPFVPGPAESQRQRRVRAQGWSHCRDSAVLGNVDSPALAMAKMYGWENRCFGDISSSNSPPQQDSPPVPSPIAWDQHGSWTPGYSTATLCVPLLTKWITSLQHLQSISLGTLLLHTSRVDWQAVDDSRICG